MKTLVHFLLLLPLVFTIGCASPYHQVQRAAAVTKKIAVVNKTVDKHQRALVDGIAKSLAQIPVAQQTKEEKLAIRLTNDLQNTMGAPDPSVKIDVPALLSDDEKIKLAAESKLREQEKQLSTALVQKEKLQAQLDDANQKLVEYGTQKAIEEHKSFWWKVKFYGGIVLAVIGFAVLSYFFPPILALLHVAISAVIGLFGRLFSMFRSG